jgi:exosome complex component CSL4
MDISKEEIVMPGDELATSEEYIAGEGTYEKNGKIFSSVIGKKAFDEAEKVAKVTVANPPVKLKPGDIVIGEVINISQSIVIISLAQVENSPRALAGVREGALHISKVTKGFVEDIRKEYRLGDLVRARVLQASPSMQLGTDSDELGVLKARCLKCRMILSKKGDALYCSRCERNEHRKLAMDYAEFTPPHVEASDGNRASQPQNSLVISDESNKNLEVH